MNSSAHPEALEGPPLRDQTVVCIITGHGLKDPETALGIETEMTEIEPEVRAVEEAMGLGS